jgi:succinate-acetate transporter protein
MILAGLQAFKAGNTFGATAFCSFDGFWLARGCVLIPLFGSAGKSIVDLLGANVGPALGVFLLAWAISPA